MCLIVSFGVPSLLPDVIDILQVLEDLLSCEFLYVEIVVDVKPERADALQVLLPNPISLYHLFLELRLLIDASTILAGLPGRLSPRSSLLALGLLLEEILASTQHIEEVGLSGPHA